MVDHLFDDLKKSLINLVDINGRDGNANKNKTN